MRGKGISPHGCISLITFFRSQNGISPMSLVEPL